MIYLVDTSVWIDFIRQKSTEAVEHLKLVIDNQLPLSLTSIIFQEILQGSKSQKDFNVLCDYLGSQYFFHPKNEVQSYIDAARIYFDCRAKAITIRSTIDCLIAQIALDYDLILLHSDKDYDRIQKVRPDLKTAP